MTTTTTRAKGRRKGYTQPRGARRLREAMRAHEAGKLSAKQVEKIRAEVESEVKARSSHVAAIHGVIGTVTGFASQIEKKLEEQNRNWGNLADDLHMSRQYLVDAVAKDALPSKLFYQVCNALDLDPTTLLQTETE